MGHASGAGASTGLVPSGIGYQALHSSSAGSSTGLVHSGMGYQALQSSADNQTGLVHSGIGDQARLHTGLHACGSGSAGELLAMSLDNAGGQLPAPLVPVVTGEEVEELAAESAVERLEAAAGAELRRKKGGGHGVSKRPASALAQVQKKPSSGKTSSIGYPQTGQGVEYKHGRIQVNPSMPDVFRVFYSADRRKDKKVRMHAFPSKAAAFARAKEVIDENPPLA
eukprot:3819776-Amphidinium_carterae.1